jgi:hypothetical protein
MLFEPSPRFDVFAIIIHLLSLQSLNTIEIKGMLKTSKVLKRKCCQKSDIITRVNNKFLKIGIGIVILIAGTVILQKTIIKPKDVHFHAGFQVYVDDKLQNFSDFAYMHEKPCTVNGKPLPGSNTNEQEEKAHLHDQIGDVVHVHRESATWNDLFINIKYPIDPKNSVGYINAKKDIDFLNRKIEPYDSLVVFIGKHADDRKYLKTAVTKDRIKQIEKKSETCSS